MPCTTKGHETIEPLTNIEVFMALIIRAGTSQSDIAVTEVNGQGLLKPVFVRAFVRDTLNFAATLMDKVLMII